MSPLDFIISHPPFHLLPREALSQVERGLEITFFPKGSKVLSRSGPKSQHLYMIRKGVARLERDGQAMVHLEEGEIFGYPSLIAQDTPAFDVIAEEDLLVYRWPEKVFRKLMEYRPFAEFFTKGLAERLRLITRREELELASINLSLPVGELVTRPPVFVARNATVQKAAEVMREHQISSVLVEGSPMGILTDRDLRNRVLALGKGPDTPLVEVMSTPVKTLPANTPIFEALSFMVRQGIHHLPLEQDGKIVGVISDTVLMQQQARSPLHLLRQLERTRSPAELKGYAQELSGIAESLFAGGLGASEIGRSVSSLNDQLIRILLQLAEERLGAPPAPYAWMALGSEGRMEQALLTDQDNALAYAEESPEARRYFAELAEYVVDGLIQAGFPPCPGGYMATHWRKPISEWQKLFQHWVETPTPQELLEAQIFFDFRKVYGELSLEALEKIVANSGEQRIFLAYLARASLQLRPPIGFLRRIKEEDGGVDIKKGGIAPIVSLARVYALEAGSLAKGTVERLKAAAHKNKLSQEGAETLIEAFGFLMRLRLRQQLTSLRQGLPPNNKIQLERLSTLERRHLKEAFLHIREMQESMSHRFHADWLG